MKTPFSNLLCIFALAAASAAFAADFPNAILADGPLAYYRFGENVTTPSYDSATNIGTFGSSAYGLYSGATHPAPGALAVAGNTGAAIPNANNGGGARVRIPYVAELNQNSQFSVEFWAKPSKTFDLGCAAASVDFNAATRFGWLFYQGNSGLSDGNGWFFRVYRTTGNTVANINMPVDTNHWYHVVGTFDGINTIKLYVDGNPVSTNTLADSYTPNSNANVPMTFGARADGAAGFFGWGGTMDEAAYYTNLLSASDVLAHYQNGTNTSPGVTYSSLVQTKNPAVYLRLNEPAKVYQVAANSGSLAAAANGKYQGGATNGAGPSSPAFPGFEVNNTAGSFDGTSGTIQVSNVAALNFTGNITLAAWIRPTVSSGLRNIISHGYTTTPNGEMQLRRNSIAYDFGSWDGTGYGVSGIMPAEDENNWVFMVGTYDGTAWKLFHNGELLNSSPNATGSLLVNADWGIGSRGGDLGDGRFFDGDIDEAAIFNKSMTAGHIMSLYFAAIGSNSAPFMVSDPPVVSPVGTIYATTPFSITADVAGTLPMSYQWRHAGTNLPGATDQTFSKASASINDSGDYVIVVGNGSGSITSSIVTVTIDPAVPPTIDRPPQSRSVYVGGQASFTVAASGTLPLTYQWKHAGTNLPGQTNATAYITNCHAAEAGAYTVGVSNVAGGVVSSPAAILSLMTPAAGSYEERLLSFGPKAYWRLNDNGTTAFDYIGGYDGTLSGGVSPGATAPASPAYPGLESTNTGYTFDPTSAGSVQVGNPTGLNFTGQISVTAWIKTASTANGLYNILSHGYTTGPNGEMCLRRQGGAYEFGSWNGNGFGVFGVPVPPEDIGNWAFLVGTYNGTTWNLYHNARLIGSAPNATGSLLVNAGWGIGSRGGNNIAGDGRYWDGDIDEVALFNRALTGQEICALYNKAVGYNGSVEPTIKVVTGIGVNTLTNQDFNTTDGGFTFLTVVPSAETDWAYTGTGWHSPGQDNGFQDDNLTFLTSPTYTVTRAGVVKLIFSHHHSFEQDSISWDGGVVEASINGSAWNRVPALSFDQNGYNGVVGSAPTLLGQQAFTGNSAGHPAFITSSCLLGGLQSGDTIAVRFVADYDFGTTGNLSPTGWEIDSVQLTQGGSGAVMVACPCGILQQTTTLGAPWTDAGNPVTIQTSSGPQRFFRVKP